jgi:hypothetical protein
MLGVKHWIDTALGMSQRVDQIDLNLASLVQAAYSQPSAGEIHPKFTIQFPKSVNRPCPGSVNTPSSEGRWVHSI